jgi:hypothetical protein
MPIRCAIYARYSSDQQRPESSPTKSATAAKRPGAMPTG